MFNMWHIARGLKHILHLLKINKFKQVARYFNLFKRRLAWTNTIMTYNPTKKWRQFLPYPPDLCHLISRFTMRTLVKVIPHCWAMSKFHSCVPKFVSWGRWKLT